MGVLVRRQRSTVQRSSENPISSETKDSIGIDSISGEPSDESCFLPPAIRRYRSSSHLFASFSDEDDESSTWSESLVAPTMSILATLTVWVQGATMDFCKNGLPWDGPICRSKRAGLSGILYALPALVASGHPYDQIMWSLQACLSILADYVYIGEDSCWHGVDRYFAIINLLAIIGRAYNSLHWSVGLLTIIPVSCYVGANRAKTRKDVNAWHFWHALWHVTGGPLACLVIYILHHGTERIFPSIFDMEYQAQKFP